MKKDKKCFCCIVGNHVKSLNYGTHELKIMRFQLGFESYESAQAMAIPSDLEESHVIPQNM